MRVNSENTINFNGNITRKNQGKMEKVQKDLYKPTTSNNFHEKPKWDLSISSHRWNRIGSYTIQDIEPRVQIKRSNVFQQTRIFMTHAGSLQSFPKKVIRLVASKYYLHFNQKRNSSLWKRGRIVRTFRRNKKVIAVELHKFAAMKTSFAQSTLLLEHSFQHVQ